MVSFNHIPKSGYSFEGIGYPKKEDSKYILVYANEFCAKLIDVLIRYANHPYLDFTWEDALDVGIQVRSLMRSNDPDIPVVDAKLGDIKGGCILEYLLGVSDEEGQ